MAFYPGHETLRKVEKLNNKVKVILFSIGTRGDIEPFVAIAQLLQERGCDVICVFPEQYREIVEKSGLSFKGFSRSILDLMESKEAKMFFGKQGSLLKRILLLPGMARRSLKLAKGSLSLQHQIQMEEKPDIILYHPKCNYSVLWGMSTSCKTILVNPTVDPLTDLGRNYGKFLNKLKFRMVYTMKAISLKIASGKFKKDYRGTKIRVSSIKKAMLEKEKTIYTLSPSLFSKPDYSPKNTYVAGFYERNKYIDWEPCEKLRQFIEEKNNILFITFGSMFNTNPEKITRSIVNVLEKNNIPAIIKTSRDGLGEIDATSGNIFFTKNLPYNWLFPKIYAVIHHGGCGTTHTSLKCGLPSLIIPHVLDQFFWDKTISSLKLGPKGISIHKFSEKGFETKLLDLYYNTEYKENAMAISNKMKVESDKNKLYKIIIE
jgi:UDP:flavonoid glycosyltransferase YjiC (YdhE family)